jgi:phosphoribosyl 1,2-cyclic phosphate phosphodiesterase
MLGTGTSQGVPVIGCHCEVCRSLDFRDKRLRSSIHIEVDGKSLVIDSGPDFRQQMLREGIEKLDALLFTHEHKDHTAGMDDIRSFNFLQKKDIPIYARDSVLEQLKREFAYVFSEVKYPGAPQVRVNEIDNNPFQVEGIDILPVEVLHYKLPVFGFRIRNFAYVTDMKTIQPEEAEKLKGLDVLILNALQKTKHISHLTLEEALEFANRIGAKKTYFTHLSHKMGKHGEVSAELPDQVAIAYDGMQIEV